MSDTVVGHAQVGEVGRTSGSARFIAAIYIGIDEMIEMREAAAQLKRAELDVGRFQAMRVGVVGGNESNAIVGADLDLFESLYEHFEVGGEGGLLLAHGAGVVDDEEDVHFALGIHRDLEGVLRLVVETYRLEGMCVAGPT